jgi:hypothetical protein
MTVTRRHKSPRVRPQQLPWERFIQAGCACGPGAPCLLHFDELDWQARALAYDVAGVKPAAGR